MLYGTLFRVGQHIPHFILLNDSAVLKTQLSYIPSPPHIKWAFICHSPVMVPSTFYICEHMRFHWLDPFRGLAGLIVAVTQTPTEAVTPGCEFSGIGKDEAMIEAKGDLADGKFDEKGENFMVDKFLLLVSNWFCLAIRVVLVEEDQRGTQKPGAPYTSLHNTYVLLLIILANNDFPFQRINFIRAQKHLLLLHLHFIFTRWKIRLLLINLHSCFSVLLNPFYDSHLVVQKASWIFKFSFLDFLDFLVDHGVVKAYLVCGDILVFVRFHHFVHLLSVHGRLGNFFVFFLYVVNCGVS